MNERQRLEREIEALRAKNKTLQANNQSLQAGNRSLGDQVESLTATNNSLSKKVEVLASTNDSLVRGAKSLSASKDELEQKCQDLRKALAKKQDELDALIRRVFGRQSERFEDDDQLKFEFASQAEIDDAREGIEQAIEENKRAGKGKKRSDDVARSVFPSHCRAAKW